jgi:creatinine amidohydrolase
MTRYWNHLNKTAFEDGSLKDAVVVVPVGATEQHGPHLPTGTDSLLADAMAQLIVGKTQTAQIIVFPTLSLTASREHHDFPGSVWIDTNTLITQLTAIGRAVSEAGIGRIVFLNAHGGNVPSLQIACRQLRIEHDLVALAAGWMTPGMPEVPQHLTYPEDVHGGFLETSVMLHFHPELVDMSLAEDFVSSSADVAQNNTYLRVLGPVSMGWATRDLHPLGAVGNAKVATADAGREIAEICAQAYAKLLDEVADYSPAFLSAGKSFKSAPQ